jgi:glutamate-1-semialdehyde 2,1-aminomutase
MDQTALFEKSKKLVPGGVHSPVRSFKGLHTTPRFVAKGSGAYITDVEGKDYIDFCMSFGPLILGHKHPKVEEDLKNALSRGWSFGACEPYSLELAEYILDRLNFGEMIRFMNSGTEAVMTAVRLARGVTKRDKILKFNGCYHGHLDSMLIKAGSGLAGTATASSAGVPEGVAADTLIVDLNDTEGVKACFSEYGNQIAAVIIEPLPANNGLLIQDYEFLKFLRDICTKHGALLIFDEVISGFRVCFKGMVYFSKVTPDIVTYGKVIGGGLPVGAVVANRDIMEHLAPVGDVYQAGTLSANPLAMVGGLSTLKHLNCDAYMQLQAQTEGILGIFRKWFDEFDNGRFKDLNIYQRSSLFWIKPGQDRPKDIKSLPKELSPQFFDLFKVLLDKGVYLSPNAFEIGFSSFAHDEKVAKDLEQRLWK